MAGLVHRPTTFATVLMGIRIKRWQHLTHEEIGFIAFMRWYSYVAEKCGVESAEDKRDLKVEIDCWNSMWNRIKCEQLPKPTVSHRSKRDGRQGERAECSEAK